MIRTASSARSVRGAGRLALCAGVALHLALSGCALEDPVTHLGNKILKTVGLQEQPVVFRPEDALSKAASEPSLENEYYLGRAVAAKLLGLFPARKDEALEEYLSYILSVVSAASERPVTFKGYKVVVLQSEEVNAMSAPGGFVLISTGLLRRLSNEDEVAAILAHEVAHIEKRHGLSSISPGKLNEALKALGVVAGSLYCGQVVQQALAVLNATVNELVDTLVTRGFSREQEYEGDQRAVSILQRAGYDPHALIGALESLEHPDHNFTGGWFSTHPSPEDRIARILGLIQASSAASPPVERKNRFRSAFKAVRGV
jgi:predicted Zn-dependent protease